MEVKLVLDSQFVNLDENPLNFGKHFYSLHYVMRFFAILRSYEPYII